MRYRDKRINKGLKPLVPVVGVPHPFEYRYSNLRGMEEKHPRLIPGIDAQELPENQFHWWLDISLEWL